MNDDIERRLRQVNVRGAPSELRPRTLAAVGLELQPITPLPSHGSLRTVLLVAAALLASLALNIWVNDSIDRRLAIVLGPPPVHQQAAEIAADVAAITDPATGRWAYNQLVSGESHREDVRQYTVRLQILIEQFTADMKEIADEAPPKNRQMDRDRRGSRDIHPAGAQCLFRLEHRDTARTPARRTS